MLAPVGEAMALNVPWRAIGRSTPRSTIPQMRARSAGDQRAIAAVVAMTVKVLERVRDRVSLLAPTRRDHAGIAAAGRGRRDGQAGVPGPGLHAHLDPGFGRLL